MLFGKDLCTFLVDKEDRLRRAGFGREEERRVIRRVRAAFFDDHDILAVELEGRVRRRDAGDRRDAEFTINDDLADI